MIPNPLACSKSPSGDVQLRQLVSDLLERAENKIPLDLAGVRYMDSSGTGELVSSIHFVRQRGAQLKLLNLSAKLRDWLMFTQLISIFEDFDDVAEVVHSFPE